jgi:hypothetical protein
VEWGLDLVEDYQIGFLSLYRDKFVAVNRDIVDVSLSVEWGEDCSLLAEMNEAGKQCTFYAVDQERFWKIVDEMSVAQGFRL